MPFALKLSPLIAAGLAHASVHLSPLFLAGTLLVLLGLACDALIIARYLPDAQFRVPPKQWGLNELRVALGWLVALFLCPTLFFSLIAALRHRDIMTFASLMMPFEFALRVGILIGFFVFFRHRKIKIRPALGLDSIRPGVAIGWGVAFGLAILPPVGMIIFASNTFCRLLRIDTAEQPIVDFLLKSDSPVLLGLLVAFAVVLAPVFEEFLFRGFAYPVLKQRFGTWHALFIVSGVFALSHLHAPSVLPLYVLALGLGLAYELTGSLLAPITMHALFNAIMILQVFYQRTHS